MGITIEIIKYSLEELDHHLKVLEDIANGNNKETAYIPIYQLDNLKDRLERLRYIVYINKQLGD